MPGQGDDHSTPDTFRAADIGVAREETVASPGEIGVATETEVATCGLGAAHLDAVAVGAGFAGLYLLHRLRGLGFSVKVIECAGDACGPPIAGQVLVMVTCELDPLRDEGEAYAVAMANGRCRGAAPLLLLAGRYTPRRRRRT